MRLYPDLRKPAWADGNAFPYWCVRSGRAPSTDKQTVVTPIYRLGLTGRDKADCAAEASTFELLGRIAHDLILLSEFSNWNFQLGLSLPLP
jgi:hypothetical protein